MDIVLLITVVLIHIVISFPSKSCVHFLLQLVQAYFQQGRLGTWVTINIFAPTYEIVPTLLSQAY